MDVRRYQGILDRMRRSHPNQNQLGLDLRTPEAEIFDGRSRDDEAWADLVARLRPADRGALGRAWLGRCDPARPGAASYVRLAAASERADDYRWGIAAGVGLGETE